MAEQSSGVGTLLSVETDWKWKLQFDDLQPTVASLWARTVEQHFHNPTQIRLLQFYALHLCWLLD